MPCSVHIDDVTSGVGANLLQQSQEGCLPFIKRSAHISGHVKHASDIPRSPRRPRVGSLVYAANENQLTWLTDLKDIFTDRTGR
jgi:hypothetical protein